jgi:putative addiction module component (TIGR02574 family)
MSAPTNPASDLLAKALVLPEPERAELAHQLLLSLESDKVDPDHEAAWAAEIEARSATVEQGNATLIDWREALDQARRALKKGPGA